MREVAEMGTALGRVQTGDPDADSRMLDCSQVYRRRGGPRLRLPAFKPESVLPMSVSTRLASPQAVGCSELEVVCDGDGTSRRSSFSKGSAPSSVCSSPPDLLPVPDS